MICLSRSLWPYSCARDWLRVGKDVNKVCYRSLKRFSFLIQVRMAWEECHFVPPHPSPKLGQSMKTWSLYLWQSSFAYQTVSKRTKAKCLRGWNALTWCNREQRYGDKIFLTICIFAVFSYLFIQSLIYRQNVIFKWDLYDI